MEQDRKTTSSPSNMSGSVVSNIGRLADEDDETRFTNNKEFSSPDLPDHLLASSNSVNTLQSSFAEPSLNSSVLTGKLSNRVKGRSAIVLTSSKLQKLIPESGSITSPIQADDLSDLIENINLNKETEQSPIKTGSSSPPKDPSLSNSSDSSMTKKKRALDRLNSSEIATTTSLIDNIIKDNKLSAKGAVDNMLEDENSRSLDDISDSSTCSTSSNNNSIINIDKPEKEGLEGVVALDHDEGLAPDESKSKSHLLRNLKQSRLLGKSTSGQMTRRLHSPAPAEPANILKQSPMLHLHLLSASKLMQPKQKILMERRPSIHASLLLPKLPFSLGSGDNQLKLVKKQMVESSVQTGTSAGGPVPPSSSAVFNSILDFDLPCPRSLVSSVCKNSMPKATPLEIIEGLALSDIWADPAILASQLKIELLKWWSQGQIKLKVLDGERFNEDIFLGEINILLTSLSRSNSISTGSGSSRDAMSEKEEGRPSRPQSDRSEFKIKGNFNLNKINPSDRVSGSLGLEITIEMPSDGFLLDEIHKYIDNNKRIHSTPATATAAHSNTTENNSNNIQITNTEGTANLTVESTSNDALRNENKTSTISNDLHGSSGKKINERISNIPKSVWSTDKRSSSTPRSMFKKADESSQSTPPSKASTRISKSPSSSLNLTGSPYSDASSSNNSSPSTPGLVNFTSQNARNTSSPVSKFSPGVSPVKATTSVRRQRVKPPPPPYPTITPTGPLPTEEESDIKDNFNSPQPPVKSINEVSVSPSTDFTPTSSSSTSSTHTSLYGRSASQSSRSKLNRLNSKLKESNVSLDVNGRQEKSTPQDYKFTSQLQPFSPNTSNNNTTIHSSPVTSFTTNLSPSPTLDSSYTSLSDTSFTSMSQSERRNKIIGINKCLENLTDIQSTTDAVIMNINLKLEARKLAKNNVAQGNRSASDISSPGLNIGFETFDKGDASHHEDIA